MKITLSETMVSEQEIKEMVDRVAAMINNDFRGEEVVVIGVLTGAFVFTADLVRKLEMPVIVDFMQVKSYEGDTSTGVLQIKKDCNTNIEGKNVIVVEDIIDTGRTLAHLKTMLSNRNPKALKICTAFDKPSRRVVEMVPDYNGITVEDKFIVGYGLDYNGLYRELKEVKIVKVLDSED